MTGMRANSVARRQVRARDGPVEDGCRALSLDEEHLGCSNRRKCIGATIGRPRAGGEALLRLEVVWAILCITLSSFKKML